MLIKINDSFYIQSAYGSSVSLIEKTERTNKETGEVSDHDKLIGQYYGVDDALLGYVRHAMNTSNKEYDCVQKYINDYREMTREVMGILK